MNLQNTTKGVDKSEKTRNKSFNTQKVLFNSLMIPLQWHPKLEPIKTI